MGNICSNESQLENKMLNTKYIDDFNILKLLTDKINDFNYVGKGGRTLLITACRSGNPKVALSIIKRYNIMYPNLNTIEQDISVDEIEQETHESMSLVNCKLRNRKMKNIIHEPKNKWGVRESKGITYEISSSSDTINMLGMTDDNNVTALYCTCFNKMNDVALALIATGKSNPEYVCGSENNTALLYACKTKMNDVALALIATGKSNPSQINKNNNTALILTCEKNLTDVALALIATGCSNPLFVHNNSTSALIHAYANNMTDVALTIVKTKSFVREQDKFHKQHALICACYVNMPEVAIIIVEIGLYEPDYMDDYGGTALIYACYNKMNDVALALIATGKSNPSQINRYGGTALIYACHNKMNDVALALIGTGLSNPEVIDETFKCSALRFACHNCMTAVALAIIKFEHTNKRHLNASEQNITTCLYNNKKFNDDVWKNMADQHLRTLKDKILLIKQQMNTDESILVLACKNNMSDVAIILIDSGMAIEQFDENYDIALTWACKNNMSDVALILTSIKKTGFAYYYATINKMTQVVNEIIEQPA
jgi:ankyrin repeat protein